MDKVPGVAHEGDGWSAHVKEVTESTLTLITPLPQCPVPYLLLLGYKQLQA